MSACNFYRDATGCCRLLTRCWSGTPCPQSEREAEAARLQYIDELVQAERRPVMTRKARRTKWQR